MYLTQNYWLKLTRTWKTFLILALCWCVDIVTFSETQILFQFHHRHHVVFLLIQLNKYDRFSKGNFRSENCETAPVFIMFTRPKPWKQAQVNRRTSKHGWIMGWPSRNSPADHHVSVVEVASDSGAHSSYRVSWLVFFFYGSWGVDSNFLIKRVIEVYRANGVEHSVSDKRHKPRPTLWISYFTSLVTMFNVHCMLALITFRVIAVETVSDRKKT